MFLVKDDSYLEGNSGFGDEDISGGLTTRLCLMVLVLVMVMVLMVVVMRWW